MDPIHPIFGIGQDPLNLAAHFPPDIKTVSPTLPPWLTPTRETAHPDPETQAAPPSKGSQAVEIDYVRLKSDESYLRETLDRLLAHARSHFQHAQYETAKEYYEQYFRYQHFYSSHPEGFAHYFTALFEMNWLQTLVSGEKEAMMFYNQELLRLLQVVEQLNTPKALDIRQLVDSLQRQQQLPDSGRLETKPEPETMVHLAKQLAKAGEPAFARGVLGFVEVYHLLEVYRAIDLAQKIYKYEYFAKQDLPAAFTQPPVLPFGFQQLGVPVAPVLPLTPAQITQHNQKTPVMQTERVDPVYALNRDPNELDERLKKQRQANNYRRQLKERQKKKRSKRRVPPVTF